MRRFILGVAITAMTTLSPAWLMAGDQETAQQIAQGLRNSGQLVDYSIGVKYQDGTAWLLGRVSSEQQSAVAVAMTQQMPGVKEVVNQLEVRPTVQAGPNVGVQQVAYPSQTSGQTGQRPSNGQAAPRGQQVMHRDDLLFGGSPTQVQYQAPAGGQARPVNYQQQSPAQLAYNGGGHGHPQAMPHMPVGGGSMPVMQGGAGGPVPFAPSTLGVSHQAVYDNPQMPCYSWPSYAAYPNYGAVTYPTQYSASAWPYIGPFYPYPQVPLGWRKVTLEWDDGWWFLDFSDRRRGTRLRP